MDNAKRILAVKGRRVSLKTAISKKGKKMSMKETAKRIFFMAILCGISAAVYIFPHENPADFPEGWRVNPGATGGKASFRIMDDPAGAYQGDRYVCLEGHMMTVDAIFVAEGDEFEVSFYSRDPEGKEVTALLYAYEANKYGGISYISTLKIVAKKAGKSWTRVEGKVSIPGEKNGKRVNAVKVVLASRTGACFDSPTVRHVRTSEWMNYLDAFYEGLRKATREDYRGALKDFTAALQLAATEEEKKVTLSKIDDMKTRLNVEKAALETEGIFARADSYISKGEYSSARREYGKLGKLAGMPYARQFAMFNSAESYRLEKNYVKAHEVYDEIVKAENSGGYYRVYGLFRQAEVYREEGNYEGARRLYEQIRDTGEALEYHVSRARLYGADTYRLEKKYTRASGLYREMLKEEEASDFPHEGLRSDLVERLENIDGLSDGKEEKRREEKLFARVNTPCHSVYVSLQGSDDNPGTIGSPFGTIKRAQEEVRKLKKEGMTEGGIAVYIRGGRYFIEESILFEGEKDSGVHGAPVVYRSYPGENVRIIGGKEIKNFKLLTDTKILGVLPEESRGKVWVCDLRSEGINDFGQLLNRGGTGSSNPAALELFFNYRPMQLARWPDEGWERVHDLVTQEGDGGSGSKIFQNGRFVYSGDRPVKWKGEKDIWTAGYFMREWHKVHTRVTGIDTEKKIISLAPDVRWSRGYPLYGMPVVRDMPYYFYNILSELSVPGEFFVDREEGKLYFYPPGSIEGSDIIVSTLEGSVIKLDGASNLVFFGLTLEANRRHGIEIEGGRDNLVAATVIRNTGQYAAVVRDGWNHVFAGCDMYHMGGGGIRFETDDEERWKKLIPSGHLVENNHIHHFNRFDGGYRPAVDLRGYPVGIRISRNLIHDSPHQVISGNQMGFNHNIIEFNEVFDVVHEARDAGAVYIYCSPRCTMSRGNLFRCNFFHHITEHSSPIKTHLVAGIYIDALNAGMTMEGNIMYRCTERAIYVHGKDNRLENNLLIDNKAGLSIGDRSWILNGVRIPGRIPLVEGFFRDVRYKQPPWSARYPRMTAFFEDVLPLGRTEGNVIERNVNVSGQFISSSQTVRMEDNMMRNNRETGSPMFFDAGNMDFRLRPGAPVFGETGREPIPFKKIGVYEDPLRASWPVDRAPAGKYYVEGKEVEQASVSDRRFPPLRRVSDMLVHRAGKRESPVTIDGRLTGEEWFGLERKKALFIGQEHKTGCPREGAESYAWISYDNEYLYAGIENSPDNWREGLTRVFPLAMALNEITIEGEFCQDTGWWDEGLPTGPLYTFSGYHDGRVVVHNLFGMPPAEVERISGEIEYSVLMIDPENQHWTAEWKIPLAAIHLAPGVVGRTRFNIGVPKRGGWFAWVATGGSIYRVDNAGQLEFVK